MSYIKLKLLFRIYGMNSDLLNETRAILATLILKNAIKPSLWYTNTSQVILCEK